MQKGSRRMSLRPALLLASVSMLGAATAGVLGGCNEDKPAPSPGPAKSVASPKPSAAPKSSVAEIADAAAPSAAVADAGSLYDGPMIGALFMQTPIMSDMEWPKEDKRTGEKTGSVRIGYIRQGSKVPVIPQPHPKSNCKEGWYELVQGGFVCGKYASLDLNHPRIKLAPHPPDTVSSLPYQYGYNVTNGTPLYRTIPGREERLKLEPWLAPKKKKPKEEDVALGESDLDAGAVTRAITAPIAIGGDPGAATDPLDAGVPWYLRDYDGGKPQVTLDELRGEGPVSRRMVKGFYLALDSDFTSNGAKWWRTTGGLLAPFERIFVNKNISEFHGIWLNGDETPQPIAQNTDAPVQAGDGTPTTTSAIVATNGAPVTGRAIENLARPGSKAQVAIILYYKARKYNVTASRKAVTTGDPVPRHTVVRLTGERVNVNGGIYDETDEGWWMKSNEGSRTNPSDVPKDLAAGEKWIDVNLTTQTLVLFEGDKPVYATAVSTGKKNEQDKEKDHRTPTGTWRIREKHIAATMDGDVASDGPYSIEDVPWIMYFNGSYALHGAFWHNNFGRVQSHGCVNLAPQDAKAIFAWTEPKMPEGWHGVWSTAEKPGTRVVVHD